MRIINIDDEIYNGAKDVLLSLGMDVDMAVNVYLRRIIMEKGLPMSMSASNNMNRENILEQKNKMSNSITRESNKKITSEMVDSIWEYFKKYLSGSAEISHLSDAISEKTGMNRGSAFIYLNVLANLVKGESNKRVIKMQDLKLLMNKIQLELGDEIYRKAIYSLEKSVPYLEEKVAGNYSKKVEMYLKNIK